MSEFKDKIPAASGKVEYLCDPVTKGISSRISGFARALYIVALSVDGKHLLSTVPALGLGRGAVYPRPSVIAYVQSDEQGMWGRNCPLCQKYFRTNHVMDVTFCPYCSQANESLAFCTKDQRTYLTAVYDTFARAYHSQKNTVLDLADVTDDNSAWHYSEEKQQFHFTCQTVDCETETDILGVYGYCPRCGRTNARKLFAEFVNEELVHLEEVRQTVSERRKREEVWEKMTVDALSRFESLAKHLRRRLLSFPMTNRRRAQLEKLNFQRPLLADESLKQWFDIGAFEWTGNTLRPARQVAPSEIPFIKKMIQRRHILIHNGGLVDQEYLELSGDIQARLDERVRVSSKEAKRFLTLVGEMGMNLLDNVEEAFICEANG